ncbi:MAG: insulinase family protein, partial [Clostridia bacterium]|nr:insulinase family protein [Clostridia bacterium]
YILSFVYALILDNKKIKNGEKFKPVGTIAAIPCGILTVLVFLVPDFIRQNPTVLLAYMIILALVQGGCFYFGNTVNMVAMVMSPDLKERENEYPLTTPTAPGDEFTVTESLAVSQGKLCIGFTTPVPSAMSEDYPALMVYNSIFGGGAHSKLFMNVREKLSLAYYAGSSYERSKGIIIVSSGIESKNFEKARDEIFLQHKAMTEGDITDTELSVSKKALINSLKAAGDSVGSIAAFYLSSILQNMTLTKEELAERIDSITKDDVVRVGKNIAPKTIYFLKGADR